VVLVIDPKEILNCYQPLWEWIEWERRNSGRYLMVLSAEPIAAERQQMVIHRLHPQGVLVGGSRAVPTPGEYVFSNRTLSYQSVGAFGRATARLETVGPTMSPTILLEPSHPADPSRVLSLDTEI
jgi:hypothetical protein